MPHTVEQLIADNLKWAEATGHSLWRLSRRRPAVREDCLQCARIGLWKAAEKYREDNPSGASFRTYANMRVRGEVLDFLRGERVVGPSMRSYARLMREGKCSGYPELFSLSHLPENSQGEEYEPEVLLPVEDRSQSMVAKIDAEKLLGSLRWRYRRMVHLYFIEGRSFEEIGGEFGIGLARTSQIVRFALRQMRQAAHTA